MLIANKYSDDDDDDDELKSHPANIAYNKSVGK
jgi:hypothetical protein